MVGRKSPQSLEVQPVGVAMDTRAPNVTLENATDSDLWLAAETVVDAAIKCHSIRFNVSLSDRARARLVDAIYRDPRKLAEIFDPANFSD